MNMKLDIGLKEWAVVCDLLLAGRISLLLRKGGIAEEQGPGRFTPAHDSFALYPSWEHQHLDGLRAGLVQSVKEYAAEPASLTIKAFARVRHVGVVRDVATLDALADWQALSAAQLDMRWRYKPERPLYALLLQVCELARPQVVEPVPAYWGCHSWVPLIREHQIDTLDAKPVHGETAMAEMSDRLRVLLDA